MSLIKEIVNNLPYLLIYMYLDFARYLRIEGLDRRVLLR